VNFGTSVVDKISTVVGATILAGRIDDLLTFSFGWLITVTLTGRLSNGASTTDSIQLQQ